MSVSTAIGTFPLPLGALHPDQRYHLYNFSASSLQAPPPILLLGPPLSQASAALLSAVVSGQIRGHQAGRPG